MSSTVKFTSDESLGESWVELNHVPDRITPLPFSSGGEEFLRLLREAQRDSTQSSARHSLASSRRDTPRDSPKSPPNSPNTELSTEDELKDIINYSCSKQCHNVVYGARNMTPNGERPIFLLSSGCSILHEGLRVEARRSEREPELLDKNTDWIYEWSSRPDQAPPKDWKFKHPLGTNKRKSYSIRTTKVGKIGLFSKEVLYTLFITNILSVLVGAGLGVWLTRRGSITSSLTIE